ncbi:arylalkylamine N-acetyltransferase-like 2 [Drosophila takahashii]|uniref:arylalkylamine N-acetyltransferase-like 2 n=1 Tax=Drosophila takahashii TaxID=29030 RepID=UPI001CF7ED01|nr:arylalkylamine N-acetyltransferase-like 2 [Drosophila takahashii]
MILSQINGITVRVMKESDYGIVKPFMKDYFHYDEPMGMDLEEEIHLLNEAEVDREYLSVISQGLSIVAFDENNRNLLVGIAVAEEMDPYTMAKQHKEAEEMEPNALGRSRKMIAKVERDARIFERCGVSKYLSLLVISVHASMRGNGLLTHLSVCLFELGRSRGFPLFIGSSTSYYSARTAMNGGLECIHSQAYADYKDDQGRPIYNPPAPHTHIRVLAAKL